MLDTTEVEMPRTEDVPERDWEPARLIPTAGIRGQEEQERRATSALLAVLPAVPDFGHALLSELKAPRGSISTFTEVRLKDANGQTHIPDGAIIVERGQTRWSCLVEVKTSTAQLQGDQVERYLSMARAHGFDGLLTISNEIRTDPDALPYRINRARIGRLRVRHMSWWRILTEAIIQHRFRGISDPDQAFILNELIRYLDDPKSGASGFEGMGESWTKVRDAARMETLRASDLEAKAVAAKWEQFIEYLCLQMSQELGVTVQRQRPRGKTPADRIVDSTKRLAAEGLLEGTIRIPDAIGPLTIEANLRSGRMTTAVTIAAPKEGRPQTRINWLLRQLKEAPGDLRLDVRFAQTKATTSALLRDCDGQPDRLLLADDSKRDPREFSLALSRPMGKKRGRTDGSFVTETRRQLLVFYGELVQNLQPPRQKAPKLPKPTEEQAPPEPAAPEVSEGQIRREQESGLDQVAQLARFVPADG
jgi:hypothetical protein